MGLASLDLESAALFLYPGRTEYHFLKQVSGGKGKGMWFELFLGISLGGSLIYMFLKSSLHCEPGFVWSPESGIVNELADELEAEAKASGRPTSWLLSLSCSLSGHSFSERNRFHSTLVTHVSVKLHKNLKLLPREGKKKKSPIALLNYISH